MYFCEQFGHCSEWRGLKIHHASLLLPYQYSTVEEAVATRTALHGVKWPQSNPKFLCADYAEQDEVRNLRKRREWAEAAILGGF